MTAAPAPEESFLAALAADLTAVLAGPGHDLPAVIGGPATEPERQLARNHGPDILAGAGQVIRHPALADVAAGLRASPPDEQSVATTALVARTLLRWRSELLGISATAFEGRRLAEAELAARVVVATTAEWNTHPDNGLAFLLLARVARLRNDLGSALQYFNLAIRLTRGRAPALASNALDSLGLLLADLGRPDDALDAFREALEIEPTARGLIDITANRAMVLTQLGEYRAATEAARYVVDTLEAAGAPAVRRAIALDNLAVDYSASGDDEAALTALDEARLLLRDSGLPVDRARNQLSRWSLLQRRGDPAARAAFADAYQLIAQARSEVDLRHYTEGYLYRIDAAVQAAGARLLAELGDESAAQAEHLRLIQAGDEALQAGLDAQHRTEWAAADELLAKAEDLCARSGAVDGLVTAVANRATLRLDSGASTDAISFVQRAHALAAELGAARQEMAALANLANLSSRGADVAESIGPLDLLMQAAALEKALPAIADGLGLEGERRAGYLWANGGIDDMLARYCSDHDAPDLAGPHWERSLAAARAFGPDPGSRFRLANRLANRLRLLPAGDPGHLGPDLVAELSALLAAVPELDRAQVTGHGAIGQYLMRTDRQQAVAHLEAAAAAQSRLTAQVPPRARPGVIAANPVSFSRLAQLLTEAGDPGGGWSALQRSKGRRVIEAVGDDGPADLTAVQRTLASLGEQAAIVDIATVPAGIMAFVVSRSGCTATDPLPTPPGWLGHALGGDVSDRDARSVEACLHNQFLAEFVAAVDRQLPPGGPVLLVPDQPLDNLPLHLVPHDGRPWGTTRPVSLLPAAGLVTAFSTATGGRPARSLVVGDSDGTLPGARRECIAVAAALGTTPLLGPDCTFEAVRAALSGDRLDVIHLALHGRGDSTRGGRAALRFATAEGAAWVPFDELLTLGLNAELVFLSGCSTALSGPVHGQGAVSAGQAALEAGAGAVIGCLWPVEDQAAADFATALYAALVPAWEAGPADVRAAMASAREALRGTAAPALPRATGTRRDGRRNLTPENAPDHDPAVTDALRWASFVLVGDPILAG